jgi:hypothetical protein
MDRFLAPDHPSRASIEHISAGDARSFPALGKATALHNNSYCTGARGVATMKLSEAILLGSTVLAPKAGGQLFAEKKAGCALGMAAVARGCSFRSVTQFDPKDRRTLGTEGVWGNWVLTPVARPCQCWRLLLPRQMRIKDIIAHLFDHHVMRRRNWTLEQLVEWVKTVEPDYGTPTHTTHSLWTAPRWVDTTGHPDEPSLEEVEEWQAVRAAFAANHKHLRTALPRNSTPENPAR